MIRFSNGHTFEYIVASGALSFDGKGWSWEQPWRWIGLLDPTLFTSVTKTLTLQSTKGNLRWYNPFRCLRLVRGGVVNAVGLSNPGIDLLRRIRPYPLGSARWVVSSVATVLVLKWDSTNRCTVVRRSNGVSA